MHQTLKQGWLAMSRGKPGRRFQDRYAKERRARAKASWSHHVRRVLLLVAALVSLVVGIFLMFVPGPAVLFYFLAATLLAGESLYLARLMDWTEVRLRAAWKWGRCHWEKTPALGRVGIVVVVVCLGIVIAFLSYRLFTR